MARFISELDYSEPLMIDTMAYGDRSATCTISHRGHDRDPQCRVEFWHSGKLYRVCLQVDDTDTV